jgi:hypothetical protein
MKKYLYAFLAFLCIATPAFAAEHAGSAVVPTVETGWSGANFAAVTSTNTWGKRAYKVDGTILKNKIYRGTLTISGYSGTGSVYVYVNGVKMSCTGSWVNSPNGLTGETNIPDNFTTANAFASAVPDFPATGGVDQREPDPNGSFRFSMNMAKNHYLPDDPMVCPGLPGASHLHQFMGNTGTNAFSTYKTLRTTGGSNCSPDSAPVCRPAYWMPAMLDGAGHIIGWTSELTYYKAIPCGIPEMQAAPDATHAGICIELANGLRWIAGYDMATGLHGPTSTGDVEGSLFTYACHGHGMRETADPNDAIHYQSLNAARSSGNPNCAVGPTNYLYASLQGPICWDGTHLDSPDHRAHMAFPSGGLNEYSNVVDTANPYGLSDNHISVTGAGISKCPTDHPYIVPSLSLQGAWKIDANFSKWHLSCDEQATTSLPDGACLHFDYWEAWSGPVKDRWTGNASTYGGCDNGRNNGNSGSLCDGSKILQANGGGSSDTNAMIPFVARNRIGWSRGYNANGTYTFELRASAGGELGVYGVAGFNGTVNLSIVDVTATGKATAVSVHPR